MNKIYFKNQVTMKKVTIIATVALCFLAVGIVAQNQSKKNQEVLNPVSQGINNNEQRSLFTDIKDQDMYLQTSDGRILDLKGNTLSSQMQTNLRLEKFERKTYEVNYLDVVVPILSKFTRVETEGVDKLANSRITPTLDPGISVIEANGGDYKFKVNTKFVLERMNREEHLSYEGEMKNGDLFESYSNKSTPVMSYGLIKKDGEKIKAFENTFWYSAAIYIEIKPANELPPTAVFVRSLFVR